MSASNRNRCSPPRPDQWKTVAGEIKNVRETFGPKTALGKRRTSFGQVQDVDREPSQKSARRRRARHRRGVRERAGYGRWAVSRSPIYPGVVFKSDDSLAIRFPGGNNFEMLCFARDNGILHHRCVKLPGGRGHGEPVRLFFDLQKVRRQSSQRSNSRAAANFLVASAEGKGFIVAGGRVPRQYPQGQAGDERIKAPDVAVAITLVEGDQVAVIGENRKLLIFPLDQVPEMTRGAGVRLQRYKDGRLSDIMTFPAKDGMAWFDSAGRTNLTTTKELASATGAAIAQMPAACRRKASRAATSSERASVESERARYSSARTQPCDISRSCGR